MAQPVYKALRGVYSILGLPASRGPKDIQATIAEWDDRRRKRALTQSFIAMRVYCVRKRRLHTRLSELLRRSALPTRLSWETDSQARSPSSDGTAEASVFSPVQTSSAPLDAKAAFFAAAAATAARSATQSAEDNGQVAEAPDSNSPDAAEQMADLACLRRDLARHADVQSLGPTYDPGDLLHHLTPDDVADDGWLQACFDHFGPDGLRTFCTVVFRRGLPAR